MTDTTETYLLFNRDTTQSNKEEKGIFHQQKKQKNENKSSTLNLNSLPVTRRHFRREGEKLFPSAHKRQRDLGHTII